MNKTLAIILTLLFCYSLSDAQAQKKNNAPSLTVEVENAIFSPAIKGGKDGIVFKPIINNVLRIREWSLTIKNEQKKIVKTFEGKRRIGASFVWDAIAKKGVFIPDGVYTYEFSIVLNAKEKLTWNKPNLVIDTVPPFITITLSEDVYFIDAKENDGIFIFLSCGDENQINYKDSNLTIFNSKGNIVRTFNFNDTNTIPEFIAWDVSDNNQKQLGNGAYKLVLTALDIAGNKAQVETELLITQAPEEIKSLSEDLKQTIYFDRGKYELNAKSIKTLQYIADVLKDNKSNKVLITGHTDSSNIEMNTNNLSLNRAKAAFDFLIGSGIDEKRIKREGLGYKQPIKNNSKVKNAVDPNRRAEITILKIQP
jgi:outer membrane protein OmpA-like peptidoglycan-associated protein